MASRHLALTVPCLTKPCLVRNVCILAHVDHGKTTLTDSLLASNGIISVKQAGQIRYMDSRDDEQERGITMQSSAVTLLYDDGRGGLNGGCGCGKCSDASIVKSTDGTMETQMEKLEIKDSQPKESRKKPTRYLVNLIDSPGHVDFAGQVVSAVRLSDGAVIVVDCVEGVCAQTISVLRQARSERLRLSLFVNKLDRLFTELNMTEEEAAMALFRVVEQVNAAYGAIDTLSEESLFDPITKGNVVFGSAKDGWAFSIDQIALILSGKLGLDHRILRENLWNQSMVYDQTSNAFKQKKSKCAFAQLCLSQISQAYKKEQPLRASLPLAPLLFQTIIDHVPKAGDIDILQTRFDHLYSAQEKKIELKPDTLIVQIAKMFAIKRPRDYTCESDDISGEVLLGMARVWTGTLRIGDSVYVIVDESKNVQVKIKNLYILMGRDVVPVDHVGTGCVFAIGGLDVYVKKTATLSSNPDTPPLHQTNPIGLLLKVALSPVRFQDYDKLVKGAERMCRADPCAETFLLPNGEIVLAVAGELHLEVCLKDLREKFLDSSVDFTCSPPIVPFRETYLCGVKNTEAWMWQDLLGEYYFSDEDDILECRFGYVNIKLRLCNTKDDPMEGVLYENAATNCRLTITKTISPNDQKALITGFKMAIQEGPLCGEPVGDCSICICSVVFIDDDSSDQQDTVEMGRFVSDTRTACHAAMLVWSPRLQLAQYKCVIQTPSPDYLGKVYSVISKRQGRVLFEEYGEGAMAYFTITCQIPILRSFGFGEELRGKTSGMAYPQLSFDGFETFDLDPFMIDEDIPIGSVNEAMQMIIDIRNRKGLYVERRITECAEKQRTRRK